MTMPIERTLCIIKPDAVEQRKTGEILQRILDEGFRVMGLRQAQLTRAQAEGFYGVHRDRPFFGELVEFVTRSPVTVVALERENAVQHWRNVIGATDPAKASEGTLRKLYGRSVLENTVHGSDSVQNGQLECGYFFSGMDLI